MNCKNCGKEIPAEALFCPYCGSAMSAQPPRPVESEMITPRDPERPTPVEGAVITQQGTQPAQPTPDGAGAPPTQPIGQPMGQQFGQPIQQYQRFGQPIPQYQPAPPKATSGVNGYGIAGFIIALISLWCGLYLCITSIVSSVLSLVGVIKMKSFKSCNGLAIAGLIIGLITLVFWGIVWIVVGWGVINGTIPV